MAKEPVENKPSFGLPAIIAALWAVALLVAFLSNRGSDVGQLQKVIGNLGGGPLAGVGIIDGVVGAIVAFLIVFAWFGLGNFAASFIKTTKSENHSHILELAMKTAVGAAIWSLIWFFLGIGGAYNVVAAVGVTIVGLTLAVFGLRRAKEAKAESRVPEKPSGLDKVLLLLIAVPVVLALIAALAPPTAKDTLLYHFALPKAFIAQGSNAFIEGNIASYLALGTEMQSVWAMLLGGLWSPRAAEAAAGATIWAFFPLLVSAIFGWARELGVSRRWSLLAVLMVASVPTAYHVAASAYIDIALALFITLGIYALVRWWKTLANGWLIFIAIFLGAALSAKLTTLFAIAAFALVVLLRVRKAKDSEPDSLIRILVAGFAAFVLAGLIASPWYLRTWQQTDSPVFPFYMSIWRGNAVGWDVERSNLFQAMNSQYGGAVKTPLDYLAAPWNLSVVAQPEQPTYFDGVLGVAFLFGLPFLIWGLWKFDLPVEAKIGVGVAAVIFLFWLFSSQQLRYLLPILPVLAIAIVLASEAIAKKSEGFRQTVQGSLAVAAAAGILTGAAWFLQKAPLRVVLGGESPDQYLTRNLDYYPYYQTLNRDTPVDAKVWLINMRRDTYNLDRPYFSDYLFESWTFRNLVWEAQDLADLKTKIRTMGVNYVLIRKATVISELQPMHVSDEDWAKAKQRKEAIAKEFILDTANTIRADEKFSLVKVF